MLVRLPARDGQEAAESLSLEFRGALGTEMEVGKTSRGSSNEITKMIKYESTQTGGFRADLWSSPACKRRSGK